MEQGSWRGISPSGFFLFLVQHTSKLHLLPFLPRLLSFFPCAYGTRRGLNADSGRARLHIFRRWHAHVFVCTVLTVEIHLPVGIPWVLPVLWGEKLSV